MVGYISYGVVTFEREGGAILPIQVSRAESGDAALRRARALLSEGENTGAVAFWQVGDVSEGITSAVVLATFGEVELGALVG